MACSSYRSIEAAAICAKDVRNNIRLQLATHLTLVRWSVAVEIDLPE